MEILAIICTIMGLVVVAGIFFAFGFAKGAAYIQKGMDGTIKNYQQIIENAMEVIDKLKVRQSE